MIADTDLKCFVYDGYGKDFIKHQDMSPDAWIQMAFQLTFYRYTVYWGLFLYDSDSSLLLHYFLLQQNCIGKFAVRQKKINLYAYSCHSEKKKDSY